MSDEDERSDERPSVSPMLAGMAAYEGLPILAAPLLGDVPYGLAKLVMSGEPIQAKYNTPISQLAEFSRSEARAIRDFAERQGVTLPIVAAGPGRDSGYMYDPAKPIQRLIDRLSGESSRPPHIGLASSSVPHAMHEIGHATPLAGSDTLRRTFQSLGNVLSQGSMIGNLIRSGLVANALIPPGEDASDTRRFLYENAPAAVGATLLPELAEEGRASYHAIRGAGKYGPGVLRTVAELTPAFGTYLAAAAAPIIATVLAKRIAEALRHRGETPKTAAPMAGAEVKAPGLLRTGASSAWHIGESPPKPKTISPAARIGTEGRERAAAKPPSKTSFYKDLLESLYNPQRGSRLATMT